MVRHDEDMPRALLQRITRPAVAEDTAGASSGSSLPAAADKSSSSSHPTLHRGQEGGGEHARVHFVDGRMLLPCGGGTLLEVLEVKPRVARADAANAIPAAEFMRALGKRRRLMVPSVGGQCPS